MKSKLAAALAEGKSSAEWAAANGVAERTAQRWAKEAEVRGEVESFRRGVLDRAVGQMSTHVAMAIKGIVRLAENAKSESVQLAALRSILCDMMAVADFTGLEERIAKLEEQDCVRHEESTTCAD